MGKNQLPSSGLKSEKPFGNNASIRDCVVNTRGINYEIAKEYLKEYYFNIDGNPSNFFGVGMAKNNEGGLNIHCGFKLKTGGWFKYVSRRNAPTIISHPDAKNYAVFEGLFDLLSYLTLVCLFVKRCIFIDKSTKNMNEYLQTSLPF